MNIVDGTIAKEDFADRDLRIDLEAQSANDGKIGGFSYKENFGGLNLTYAYKDSSLENYDIPEGAIIHPDEVDHDPDEDELDYLENSDYGSQSHRLGLSTVGNWGHFGASFRKIESLYGIPFHSEEHEDPDGEPHEDERIFSTTDYQLSLIHI